LVAVIYFTFVISSSLHHVEYSSPSIIRMIESRRMRWAGLVGQRWEKSNAYGTLVGNPVGKRPLRRPRRR
jgi:hypothetical protein